jgi:hypothetical protein
VTGSSSAVTTPSGVEQVVLFNGNYIVKPSDTSLHQAYTFHVKVTALGGSTEFFGPFVMNVGCFAGAVSYTDSTSLVTSVSKSVGDSLTAAYTFSFPTTNRVWCTVLQNVIVATDGSAWTDTVRFNEQGS